MTRIPKAARRDPVRWARRALATVNDGGRRDELARRARDLVPLAESLALLDVERGRTSRHIGEARARGKDTTEDLAAMRDIGTRRRALEPRLDELLTGICALLDEDARELAPPTGPGARDDDPLPAYFDGARRHRESPSEAARELTVHAEFDAAEYTDYVRSHPARTAYHDIGLRDLVTGVLGQRCHHLIARDERGRVRGVLPLVRLETRPFGTFAVSMPWFNYGGPLADDERASHALVSHAARLARDRGCRHLEVRETRAREGWASRTHKVSMTLALPDSVAALERNLGSSLRAQSARAERASCTFATGRHALLDDFHRVFSINMRDLGTPVPGPDFFGALLDLFPRDAFLAVVSRRGAPVAAGFLLAHGDTLEIPWASSLRRANPLGVNMLLYRRTLGEAVARGYRHFDFGRSSPGGSTWRFKRQWGARARPLHWHYWMADGADAPQLSPDSPKYRFAIAIWKRLPVALTRAIGPRLARGLP